MITIGITGGVGCGKSEILRYLKEHYGCRVILTDNCAKDMEKKGGSLYEPVCSLLQKQNKGPFLTEDGEIDKSAMAAMIFADPVLLSEINNLVHPAVVAFLKEEIRREKERGELEFLVVESALMVENKFRSFLDEIWYIYCDEKNRRERLILSRGYSLEKIESIMSRQVSEAVFREETDVTIDNSGSLADAMEQVDEQIRRLRSHEI